VLRPSGAGIQVNQASAYAEYTFFGTGFQLFGEAHSTHGTATVELDSGSGFVSMTAANFPSATFTSAGLTYNDGTATVSFNTAPNSYNASYICEGLPLGYHTLRINHASSWVVIECLDIISPIYRPVSLTSSAQSSSNSRATTPVETTTNKADIGEPKAWVIFNSVTDEIVDSHNISAVVDYDVGRWRVFFDKKFKRPCIGIGTGSEDELISIIKSPSGTVGGAYYRNDGMASVLVHATTSTGGSAGSNLHRICCVFYGDLDEE
jgi:hypothetical protein